MTLLEWGALGELIGGIAIIVSLIYVGRQLKQSNSMARSGVRQEISSELNFWATSIACSPSLGEALTKVHLEGLVAKNATGLESVQLAYILSAFVSQQHFAYEQWKEGNLTDREMEDLFGPPSELLSMPYLKSIWGPVRKGFPKDFVEWYEERYDLRRDD